MDPKLSELLSSNEAPSDATIDEVKGLLAKPLQELSETDVEIQRIEKVLQGLREKRETVQQSVTTYQIILSPARRIPHDVLREIFYHCLPTHRNSLMKAFDAPLLLTRVCSAWRSAALSSPRIWARLHIPFPGSMPSGPYIGIPYEQASYSTKTVEDYPEIMKTRCEVVKEWLSRSGTCPLSISLTYPSFHATIEDSFDTQTEMLFDTVLAFSQRWKDIELSMPFDIYEKFQTKITLDMVPMLVNLRASFHERERTGLSPRLISLLSAPTLQGLSLSAMGVTWNFNTMPRIWDQLSYLCLHSSFPDTDMLDLLKACRNLVDCRLMILSRWDPSVPYDTDSHSMAFLPHLKTFSITDGGSVSVMTAVFKAIVAPSMKWIDYHKSAFYAHGEDTETMPSPLVSLLEGATTIEKLTFQPRGIRSRDIMHCLCLPTRLTHLVLGQEPFFNNRTGRYSRSHVFPLDTFSIDPLIVEEGSSLEKGDDIPLPYLEELEAYQISSVSDKSLLTFICSRIGDAAARSGISSLRRVVVEFDRPLQMDITGEVRRHAKEAGVEVKLDLYYPPDHPSHLEPLSTAFGLSETGRSWSYPDIETGWGQYDWTWD